MPRDLTPLELIHPHWINKFHLDSLEGEVKIVPARSLVGPWRFGIFAKMAYIRYRDSRPCLARRVYLESIRATNPFGKEYGKEKEKSSFRIFVRVFNELIKRFSAGEFDPKESIVPVGGERHIIDGEHRIAALSFFDKDVTICEFPSAEMPCFDYDYYKERWMSDYCRDLAACECVNFIKGLRVLFLWPGAHIDLSSLGKVCYSRSFHMGSKSYTRLRLAIDPIWRGEAADGETRVVFYLPSEVDFTPEVSGDSTNVFDPEEVTRVSNLVLTWRGRRSWYRGGGIACRILAPFEMFWDKLSSYIRFVWSRFKLSLGNSDSKLWLFTYNFFKPLWKRNDKTKS